jgi:CIC family chloride channel protein
MPRRRRHFPDRARLSRAWDEARLRLGHPDALLQLAVLGLVTGVLAGGVIVLFRVVVEGTQGFMLPGNLPENYEALAAWQRLLLPLAGAALIAWLFHRLAGGGQVLGVTKLLERMAYHQGRMDWQGFFLQFLGAALAIISGHPVGREGPHVYLGAASGSLLGQHLALPHNVIRTLVGCGTAAGIAASFNTPLAGVIFSLEVVMLEYTLASFIPVMLAAAGATLVSNAVLGARPAFATTLGLDSLAEVPLVLVLGLAAGAVSALFNHLVENVARLSRPLAFTWRVLLAGVVAGLAGGLVPEVMGIGYDTVGRVLQGDVVLDLLVLVLVAKLLATGAVIGLGIPGGLIGPVLFMGALLGGAAGVVAEAWLPGDQSSPAFYALLGMGAMMGASLQAPLAALTAIMELTYTPGIIMPGMLAVVVAGLVSNQLFGKPSLFLAMLRANGMDYDTNPVLQAMRRVGVAGIMNRRLVRLPERISRGEARTALEDGPDWVVIDGEQGPELLMPALDLARNLEQDTERMEWRLKEIPAQRYQLTPVHHQATLQEAMDRLNSTGAEAVYVEQAMVPGVRRIYGILTRGRIESAYRYGGQR